MEQIFVYFSDFFCISVLNERNKIILIFVYLLDFLCISVLERDSECISGCVLGLGVVWICMGEYDHNQEWRASLSSIYRVLNPERLKFVDAPTLGKSNGWGSKLFMCCLFLGKNQVRLEILENLEILEILENRQTLENKGEFGHFLEILENVEILETPPVERPLS